MDNILKQVAIIQRIASQESVDFEDLEAIWRASRVIEITRQQQLNEAAFLASAERELVEVK